MNEQLPTIDELADKLRIAHYAGVTKFGSWESCTEDYRRRWRDVARTAVAAGAQAQPEQVTVTLRRDVAEAWAKYVSPYYVGGSSNASIVLKDAVADACRLALDEGEALLRVNPHD